MSPSHSAALVTYPLLHEQTNPSTIVKHQRKLEDFCVSSQLDIIIGQMMITYTKPPGTSAADKRSKMQRALFLTSLACQDENPWLLSEAFRSQILKDISLTRVSDMVGYDDQARPSPAARVEQTLDLFLFWGRFCFQIFFLLWDRRVDLIDLWNAVLLSHFISVCGVHHSRKGVPAHAEILHQLLQGVAMDEASTVVVMDLLPNKTLGHASVKGFKKVMSKFSPACEFRNGISKFLVARLSLKLLQINPDVTVDFWHVNLRVAEYARAVTQRLLNQPQLKPKLAYFGLFTKDQRDTIGYLENFVYTWWDGSSEAPAKVRPQPCVPPPQLNVLTWHGSAPGFGAALMQKFPPDSLEYSELQSLVQQVKGLYPSTVVGDVGGNRPGQPPPTVRAAGKPDFSIEGGPVKSCFMFSC